MFSYNLNHRKCTMVGEGMKNKQTNKQQQNRK